MLFAASILIGAAVGLINGIATQSAENQQARAAAAGVRRDQAEGERRRGAAAQIGFNVQNDMLRDLDTQQRQSAFEIDTQRIQQERAIGSTRAAVGASGLRGTTKEGVIDRVRGDFDRVIGEMETRRGEAREDARRAIEISRLQTKEGLDRMTADIDRLDAEGDALETEAADFDVLRLGFETIGGALGGATRGVGDLFPSGGTGTPASVIEGGTESLAVSQSYQPSGYVPPLVKQQYGL